MNVNVSRALTFTGLAIAVGSVVMPELGFAGQTDIAKGINKINTEAQSSMGDIVDIGLMALGAGIGLGGGKLLNHQTGGVVVGGGLAIAAPAVREWMYAGTAAGGASIDALLRMASDTVTSGSPAIEALLRMVGL